MFGDLRAETSCREAEAVAGFFGNPLSNFKIEVLKKEKKFKSVCHAHQLSSSKRR